MLGLDNPVNAQVLAHLQGRSAHSDVAEALMTAVKPLGDVQLFSPNPSQYAYLVAVTEQVVFAFASGMAEVCFRLGTPFKARAMLTGATAYPACGDEWVSFTLFRDDWPKFDLEFWARKAYVFARE